MCLKITYCLLQTFLKNVTNTIKLLSGLSIESPKIGIANSKMIPLAFTKEHRPTVMHVARCRTGVRLSRRLWFCSHHFSFPTNVSPSVVDMKTAEQPGLLLAITHAYDVSGDQISAGLGLYR